MVISVIWNLIGAVGKLDPFGSNSGSNLGGSSGNLGCTSHKKNIVSLLSLDFLELLRKVLISVNSGNESCVSVKVDGGSGTNKKSHSK